MLQLCAIDIILSFPSFLRPHMNINSDLMVSFLRQNSLPSGQNVLESLPRKWSDSVYGHFKWVTLICCIVLPLSETVLDAANVEPVEPLDNRLFRSSMQDSRCGRAISFYFVKIVRLNTYLGLKRFHLFDHPWLLFEPIWLFSQCCVQFPILESFLLIVLIDQPD